MTEPAPDFGPCVAWTRHDALCRLRARTVRVIWLPATTAQTSTVVVATGGSHARAAPDILGGAIARTVGLCPFHQRLFDRTAAITVLAHPLRRVSSRSRS